MNSCSEKKLLKGAEKELKEHIGNVDSYERIEWCIVDTIYENEDVLNAIDSEINVENKFLQILKDKFYGKNPPIINLPKNIRLHTAEELFTTEQIIVIRREEMESRNLDSLKLFKLEFKIDSLTKESNYLRENIRKSQISHINIKIRFRAKMGNPDQLTYRTYINYYPDIKYIVTSTYNDGIESDMN